MKRSSDAAPVEHAKQAFTSALTARLSGVPGVLSVTFTGSFVDRADLAGISDIDVVVVVAKLSEAVFAQCRAQAEAVPPTLLGLPSHRIRVNDTFGPLKHDEPGVVVVHLMVYDVAGHREHVLKSPFTCLDWERSPAGFGPSLREIYPVLGLFPRHFAGSRRSLATYLDDLTAGSIQYRRYQFAVAGTLESVERMPIDARHQGEYAFHIVHHLVANYAKMILGQNRQPGDAELRDFWRRHLPRGAAFIPWFDEIAVAKRARLRVFPPETLARTRAFVAAFTEDLREAWEQRATLHRFVRHAATPLNDGSFLGQGRDPDLLAPPPPLADPPGRVVSSPARRCLATAAALAPGLRADIDPRLLEIDYGAAEGLTYPELAQRHPAVVDAWARGEDRAFPGGENQAAVLARLEDFCATLDFRPTLVVTHNVVLRALLGRSLGLPVSQWHQIPVAHLEEIRCYRRESRTYLDLTDAQVERISDRLARRP